MKLDTTYMGMEMVKHLSRETHKASKTSSAMGHKQLEYGFQRAMANIGGAGGDPLFLNTSLKVLSLKK